MIRSASLLEPQEWSPQAAQAVCACFQQDAISSFSAGGEGCIEMISSAESQQKRQGMPVDGSGKSTEYHNMLLPPICTYSTRLSGKIQFLAAPSQSDGNDCGAFSTFSRSFTSSRKGLKQTGFSLRIFTALSSRLSAARVIPTYRIRRSSSRFSESA